MTMQILATKLYIPPLRQKAVPRSRLIGQLNAGLSHAPGIILISASAGSGKTTLVSEWVASLTLSPSPSGKGEGVRIAWLSLDKDDSNPTRFLTYLVSAVQIVLPHIGTELLAALQTSQP